MPAANCAAAPIDADIALIDCKLDSAAIDASPEPAINAAAASFAPSRLPAKADAEEPIAAKPPETES